MQQKLHIKRKTKQKRDLDGLPLWRRNSPALCFFMGALSFAFSAFSLCFSFTLKSLIIISKVEINLVLVFNVYKISVQKEKYLKSPQEL